MRKFTVPATLLLVLVLLGCDGPAPYPVKADLSPPSLPYPTRILYQSSSNSKGGNFLQPMAAVIKGDLLLVHCDRNERLSAHTTVSDTLRNHWREYDKNNFEAVARADGGNVVTCGDGTISFLEFEGEDSQP